MKDKKGAGASRKDVQQHFTFGLINRAKLSEKDSIKITPVKYS